MGTLMGGMVSQDRMVVGHASHACAEATLRPPVRSARYWSSGLSL